MIELRIAHLFDEPRHLADAAAMIHEEFWRDVPGASVQGMQARLCQANNADALPLCLVALQQDRLMGLVNLVHNDDETHPEWSPWLAGMLVAAPWRGMGVGSALVRALLGHARRLQVPRVYLGTDGPEFYLRLGALHHQQPRDGFWFMRFDLDSAA